VHGGEVGEEDVALDLHALRRRVDEMPVLRMHEGWACRTLLRWGDARACNMVVVRGAARGLTVSVEATTCTQTANASAKARRVSSSPHVRERLMLSRYAGSSSASNMAAKKVSSERMCATTARRTARWCSSVA
jgi:hypothetical protein